MSLFSDILSGLIGSGDSERVTHPCSNCESDCRAYPNACEECRPYKEQLVDALYNVANIDAFYSRYEVAAAGSENIGTSACPACGAPVSGAVCEYCGTRIAGSGGKIQVSSANDIPNPIIEARDIIYSRRSVIDKYLESTDSGSSGILGTLVSAFTGNESESSLGNPMTEAEIKAMAEQYGVSVRDYLEGLDMGTYLSKSGYRKQQSEPSRSGVGMAAGAMGIGAAAGMLAGNNSRPPHPQSGSYPAGYQSSVRHGMEPPHSGRPTINGNSHSHRDGAPHHGAGRPSQPSAHSPHHDSHGGGHGGRGPDGRGR